MQTLSVKSRGVSIKDLPKMEPRLFCRLWFNATEYEESSRGYRKQCVKLIARIVGLEEDTVDRWGAGVDFSRMPTQYKKTLSYAYTVKQLMEEAGRSHPDILREVTEKMQQDD